MTKLHIFPCLSASLVFLFAVIASPQQPAEVPVDKEPHHHLVFENEYVRVFKVEVAPKEATLVHRHSRDYVVVTIGEAEVTNAVIGKEPKRWSFVDGDVRFLEASGEKSFAHKAVNEGEKPFVNYTIEVKAESKMRPAQDAPERGYCSIVGGDNDASWCSDKKLYIGCHLTVNVAREANTFSRDAIVYPTLVVVVNNDRRYKGKTLFWVSKFTAFPRGLTRGIFLSFNSVACRS